MSVFGDKKRQTNVGTQAARLARNVQTEVLGARWIETDTGRLWEVGTTAGADYPSLLVHAWVLAGGTSGGGWGNYVVSPDIDIAAPYATVASAIAAAFAAGHGPASPIDILIMPAATYVENLTLRTGINLRALASTGSEDATPAVTIQGEHTIANVAGTLTLEGINFEDNAGVPITLAGNTNIVLNVLRCRIATPNTNSKCVDASNTGASSEITFEDSRVVPGNAGAGPFIGTSVKFSAYRTWFEGKVNDTMLQLALLTIDELYDCKVFGNIIKESGILTMHQGVLDASTQPAVAGSATWDFRDVTAPDGLSFADGTNQLVRRTWHQHQLSNLAGAGPVTITVTDGDTVTLQPLLNGEMVVNLPDVTSLVDGAEYTIVMVGTVLGAAVAVLTAFGAQSVGRAAGINWYRLYENGTVTLRANVAEQRWDIAAEQLGIPQDLALTVDPVLGDDGNPGTVARPVLTVVNGAARIAARSSWTRNGKATVVDAGTEDWGATAFQVPAGTGPLASPFQVIGTIFNVTGGFAASYVTNAAGTAFAAGPPLVLTRFAIAATAAFAANAARGSFVRPTNGPLAGRRLAVIASTNTTVDVAGSFVAPGNATTFIVEQPAFNLESLTGGAIFGAPLLVYGIRLNGSDFSLQINGTAIAAYATIFNGDGSNTTVELSRASVLGGGDSGLGFGTAAGAPFSAIAPTFSDGIIVNGLFSGDTDSTVVIGASEFADASVGAETTTRPYLSWTIARCGVTGSQIRYSGNALFWQDIAMRDATLVLSAAGGSKLINLNFVNTGAGLGGILADYGSSCVLTNIQGTVTAGQDPVSSQHGSHVIVTDPNTGTTVSDGAGRNAIVGVIGNQTWAQINVGLYANINDNFGAPAGGTGATISK